MKFQAICGYFFWKFWDIFREFFNILDIFWKFWIFWDFYTFFKKFNLRSIFPDFEYFSEFCPKKGGTGFLGSRFFRLWLLDLRITSFFVALIQNRSRIPVEQNRAMQRCKPTKIKAHIFKVFLNLLISDTKLGPRHHQYYPPKAGQPQRL